LTLRHKQPNIGSMNLPDLKKKHSLSNRQLANLAGLHESFLSRFLRGQRRLSYPTAKRIAQRIHDATGEHITLKELLVPENFPD